jgi:hypothetical protein
MRMQILIILGFRQVALKTKRKTNGMISSIESMAKRFNESQLKTFFIPTY